MFKSFQPFNRFAPFQLSNRIGNAPDFASKRNTKTFFDFLVLRVADSNLEP